MTTGPVLSTYGAPAERETFTVVSSGLNHVVVLYISIRHFSLMKGTVFYPYCQGGVFRVPPLGGCLTRLMGPPTQVFIFRVGIS